MFLACLKDSQTDVWFSKSRKNNFRSRLSFVFPLTGGEIRYPLCTTSHIPEQIFMSASGVRLALIPALSMGLAVII